MKVSMEVIELILNTKELDQKYKTEVLLELFKQERHLYHTPFTFPYIPQEDDWSGGKQVTYTKSNTAL